MKRTEYKVIRFNYGRDYYVEVTPVGDMFEYYLGHNSYGVKLLMFGEFSLEDSEELIEDNIEEYINIYKEEVED